MTGNSDSGKVDKDRDDALSHAEFFVLLSNSIKHQMCDEALSSSYELCGANWSRFSLSGPAIVSGPPSRMKRVVLSERFKVHKA